MKLAFITPRYGVDIATGPEHGCRLLAEQLSKRRYEVDVLTTCARHSSPWKNEYPEGSDRIRGVLVRRFSVVSSRYAQNDYQLMQQLVNSTHSQTDELEWVRKTGPVSPGLIDFLRRNSRHFDALVFFSYRHATTIQGMPIAPKRSLLFPSLRLEPALRLNITRETIEAAAGIGYFSSVERQLLRLHTHNATLKEKVVGIGIQAPPQQADPRLDKETSGEEESPSNSKLTKSTESLEKPYLERRGSMFKRRHRLDGKIVLYPGQVKPDTGCEELLEYFDRYAAQDNKARLVLMGAKLMQIPTEPYLQFPGILLPSQRFPALEAADVTIAPEPDDLLAEPVLQSFAVGTPVLANARNQATVAHCQLANGGLYYSNCGEFIEALQLLTSNEETRSSLGQNAREYVTRNFQWETVIGRFEQLLRAIKNS